MKKNLPWILCAVFALWLASSARVPRDREWAVQEFGRLPILFEGRFQPMDSVARNTLLRLREKQSANTEPWKSFWEKPKILSATEWFMDLTMRPEKADTYPVFRVDHPELISLLKLPDKDKDNHQDGKHYSWELIGSQTNYTALRSEAERIDTQKKEASTRNPYEQAVMKLHGALNLYIRLKSTIQPPNAVDFAADIARLESAPDTNKAAMRSVIRAIRQEQQLPAGTPDEVLETLRPYVIMSRMDPPFVLPPSHAPHPGHSRDEWAPIGVEMIDFLSGAELNPAIRFYARMGAAYRQGQADKFNAAVRDYHSYLAGDFAPEGRKAKREQAFNHFAPFYKAMVIYVLAFLLACSFWFNLSEPLRRSAVWLILLAFVVHTVGLITRMILEGRPPVTNLYSSAIFIGWGAVILGIVLERFYKDGIGAVVASAVGFITLVIAHNLALGGDTMVMMEAVLDTNFWLATHVVIVTLGYASTFVAGFLALIYVLRGVFTTGLSEATGKALARMVYGIICFATLFSFVGTVLGGIWADQSWGRFWGWDPKENGALIIVLWNALILHARWGGMVKERGLMNLALVGNIVTSWSWFGVNMLGIGLHSYGFMDTAFKWLMFFVATQLTLIALGLLPDRYWPSLRARAGALAGRNAAAGGGKEKSLAGTGA